MSPYTIRRRDPETGQLPRGPIGGIGARRSTPRFEVFEAEHGVSVRDHGKHAFYTTEGRGFQLAGYLNRLDPTSAQLDVFRGEGAHVALLKTIALRADAVCHRCGRRLPAGKLARWHKESKLIRHVGRCPKPASATRKRRRTG